MRKTTGLIHYYIIGDKYGWADESNARHNDRNRNKILRANELFARFASSICCSIRQKSKCFAFPLALHGTDNEKTSGLKMFETDTICIIRVPNSNYLGILELTKKRCGPECANA